MDRSVRVGPFRTCFRACASDRDSWTPEQPRQEVGLGFDEDAPHAARAPDGPAITTP